MNTHKIALGTFATAALVLGGTGAAHATSSAAVAALPGSLCEIQVISVRALDLQDNDGLDETRLRIGDKTSVTRTYFTGQLRNVLADNTYDLFTSSELVKVVEVDPAGTTVIGSAASIPCVNRTATSLVSTPNGNAIYEVRWDVDVLVP